MTLSSTAGRHRHRILVLLPVYNGARWLEEQIDSIIRQESADWCLWVRDDGSSDNSLAILRDYAHAYPEQIKCIEDDQGNLGASASFSRLMMLALQDTGLQNSDRNCYFALADQDDTWHPHKLQITLQQMLDVERDAPEQPVLVHSDLRVVDEKGVELAASLIAYQGLDSDKISFPAQLVSNTVTGCTTLLNRALLEHALPVPPQAMMHDWWLSLVASRFGQLSFIHRALVDYRQHGSNTLGARAHIPLRIDFSFFRRLFARQQSLQAQQLFRASAAQAAAFRDRYEALLSAHDRHCLDLICDMPNKSLWGQRILFRRMHRLRK
ncbi:glycosyltransferase family 2 protein [Pseudohongiella spirulinae]|uniref:Glycosyl transferase family 2 n=1 Tax=Pseudohongiella spirulinae TaxID=1249552 RepID=A0A0S2K9W3_9GAMM|nr:glycosyltransferase family 2 protein [Pseudohongiella spirulinae]ALO45105.1 Glycosyl transferase family 2 [Pseudohongiella spirulinae]